MASITILGLAAGAAGFSDEDPKSTDCDHLSLEVVSSSPHQPHWAFSVKAAPKTRVKQIFRIISDLLLLLFHLSTCII